jgi:hypothetical protein
VHRAPQAAVETPGIKYAGKRIPNIPEGMRLARQRTGAADLDHSVRALGEFQYLREVVQGWEGAGGTRGCNMPRWSMMNRVSGWRSDIAVRALADRLRRE